jgi:hypothetical protein
MSLTEHNIDIIWCAWYEMNAIQAREGAPEGICHAYWNDVVNELEYMLPKKYQNPWHPKYVRKKENENNNQR